MTLAVEFVIFKSFAAVLALIPFSYTILQYLYFVFIMDKSTEVAYRLYLFRSAL